MSALRGTQQGKDLMAQVRAHRTTTTQEGTTVAVLDAKQRNALPDSAFALPGRRYPIHDLAHARDALARVAQNGTPAEQAKVRAAVSRRYPGIGDSEGASDQKPPRDEREAARRFVNKRSAA